MGQWNCPYFEWKKRCSRGVGSWSKSSVLSLLNVASERRGQVGTCIHNPHVLLHLSSPSQKVCILDLSKLTTATLTSGVSSYPRSHRLSQSYLLDSTVVSAVAAAAKSPQSCPTLCDPTDGSPPGSPVPGSLQVRTLEWAAISFSNAWKWKMKVKSLSRVQLLATPWTTAFQALPSRGFSRQESWSGVPLPSPESPLLSYYSQA